MKGDNDDEFVKGDKGKLGVLVGVFGGKFTGMRKSVPEARNVDVVESGRCFCFPRDRALFLAEVPLPACFLAPSSLTLCKRSLLHSSLTSVSPLVDGLRELPTTLGTVHVGD